MLGRRSGGTRGGGWKAATTSTSSDSPAETAARRLVRLADTTLVALVALTDLPDALQRPAARPLEVGDVPVGGARVRRRARLDQVLDLQPVRPEQPDPLAVGKLEVDRFLVPGPHAEVVDVQAAVESLALGVPTDERERAQHVEREQAARPEHPRGLRDRRVGVGERHRPVVAEHDVEARVRERHALGVGVHDRERDPGAGHQARRVPELRDRQIQADGTRAHAGEADRPLRGSAPELQDVLPGDVTEDLQPGLGQAPDPPGRTGEPVELARVLGLVLVARPVPEAAVLADVTRGSAHRAGSGGSGRSGIAAGWSREPPDLPERAATRAAAIDRAISTGCRPPRSSPTGDRMRARSFSAMPIARRSSRYGPTCRRLPMTPTNRAGERSTRASASARPGASWSVNTTSTTPSRTPSSIDPTTFPASASWAGVVRSTLLSTRTVSYPSARANLMRWIAVSVAETTIRRAGERCGSR